MTSAMSPKYRELQKDNRGKSRKSKIVHSDSEGFKSYKIRTI